MKDLFSTNGKIIIKRTSPDTATYIDFAYQVETYQDIVSVVSSQSTFINLIPVIVDGKFVYF